MSLNETPSGERIHIGFFGMRNAGKSSLVNVVTGQQMSVVSDIRGTTTDPVTKAMELLPLGPVQIIDTPGFDDTGALGELRVRRTEEILDRSDIAVLVVDGTAGFTQGDEELLAVIQKRDLPYLIVLNKSDLAESALPEQADPARVLRVSARTGEGVEAFKERLSQLIPAGKNRERHLAADLVRPGDSVVLVIPIDESAPKGRLILPQQQVIRDLLERGCLVTCVRETELTAALDAMNQPPALVITDSQAFEQVARETPADIPLTSFSILMARYKGFLAGAVQAVRTIETLQDGERILISEGCTHHRQCQDIGTVKIPGWLRQHTGKNLVIETSSGRSFPRDLSGIRVVIHCGGCMLNEQEIASRQRIAQEQGVPFTNYGTLIAYMKGILERSIQILPEIS